MATDYANEHKDAFEKHTSFALGKFLGEYLAKEEEDAYFTGSKVFSAGFKAACRHMFNMGAMEAAKNPIVKMFQNIGGTRQTEVRKVLEAVREDLRKKDDGFNDHHMGEAIEVINEAIAKFGVDE